MAADWARLAAVCCNDFNLSEQVSVFKGEINKSVDICSRQGVLCLVMVGCLNLSGINQSIIINKVIKVGFVVFYFSRICRLTLHASSCIAKVRCVGKSII